MDCILKAVSSNNNRTTQTLDEEFEESLRHLKGEKCTGDRNEMAQLPEGITELLYHEKLSLPLKTLEEVCEHTGIPPPVVDIEVEDIIQLEGDATNGENEHASPSNISSPTNGW